MFKVIGIIGAMAEEVELLIDKMTNKSSVKKAGMIYYMGELYSKEVIVVECGIGKINAAVCTQILISEFKVDVVINTGVAGSLRDELNIGDIVVSEDTLNHDMDTTAFGDDYGVVPRMDNSIFKADERLIDIVLNLGRELTDINVLKGRVLSGDQFISDGKKKEWLKKQFNGSCVEMEGVAVGQTAYLNETPFLILRAISDKSDGSAHMDYPEFKKHAIENLSGLVFKMLTVI